MPMHLRCLGGEPAGPLYRIRITFYSRLLRLINNRPKHVRLPCSWLKRTVRELRHCHGERSSARTRVLLVTTDFISGAWKSENEGCAAGRWTAPRHARSITLGATPPPPCPSFKSCKSKDFNAIPWPTENLQAKFTATFDPCTKSLDSDGDVIPWPGARTVAVKERPGRITENLGRAQRESELLDEYEYSLQL